MSPSIQTQIRQHLQANDDVQAPIGFEEIISRLEPDASVAPAPAARYVRGIWVAAAAAVITLLLLGLIPLFSGSEQPRPADTLPPPTTPSTAASATTIATPETQDGGDTILTQRFTAIPSDPIAVEGSLTWRTVELPAPGQLTVGLDDRIYLLAEDFVWVSRDGVDWTGYPVAPPVDGYRSAIGEDILIDVRGGGGVGDVQSDEPDTFLPVTVAVYDLSAIGSEDGEVTLIAESPLPASDGDGPESVAIGRNGAVVATSARVFYSELDDQWTPVEGLPEGTYAAITAASDRFYITDGTTVFYSTDGIEWTLVHESSSPIRAIGRWGDRAIADDGEAVWGITPQGGEVLYTSNSDRTGPSPWIWQITGSPLSIMSIQADTGRYLYSTDGIDWEDMALPEGWRVSNVFVEDPIAMNSQTILVVASASEGQDGGGIDGKRVLMATP
ncbi:MAG TPA: hypothetical protein VF115_09400 [Acidimicrobiia bacterium]